jgi:uncharacterized protein YdaU (DUF1376 family)
MVFGIQWARQGARGQHSGVRSFDRRVCRGIVCGIQHRFGMPQVQSIKGFEAGIGVASVNFYKRYLRDTLRLSMLEDGAYNRLIDCYYSSEEPLPLAKDELYTMTRALSAKDREAVDKVIARFFTQTTEGYRHKRIDEEIEKSKTKAEANRTNGKSGGRPRKDQTHG